MGVKFDDTLPWFVSEETVSPELTQAWSGETEVKFTCEFTATLAESPSSVKWFKNSNQQMENEAGKNQYRNSLIALCTIRTVRIRSS